MRLAKNNKYLYILSENLYFRPCTFMSKEVPCLFSHSVILQTFKIATMKTKNRIR